jgi:hypothetical protein
MILPSLNGDARRAAAWARLAPQLAAWAWRRLVNHTDAWGAYWPQEGGHS